VDEDFLAQYQMSYGFTDTSTAASAEEKVEDTGDKEENSEDQPGMKRKAGPQEPSKLMFYNFRYLFIQNWRIYVTSCFSADIGSFILFNWQRLNRPTT
jgi:hypothetical protein